MDTLGVSLERLSKASLYAALLLAVGVCACRWLLLTAFEPAADGRYRSFLVRRLGRLGLVAGVAAIISQVARAWAHTAQAFGTADAFLWENIRTIVLVSQWGAGWRLQVGAAVALTLSFVWARARGTAAWVVSSSLALLTLCTLPLLGHAAGSLGRSALHIAHLVGAGVWLGTLLAVFAATHPRALHASATPAAGATDDMSLARDRAELLHHFASVALPGAALLLGSGASAAWIYVGTFDQLLASAYGRALIVKLTALAAILACGFANWRRYRSLVPQAGFTPQPLEGERPLPSTTLIVVELALAALAVLATGFLTELEHPTSSS